MNNSNYQGNILIVDDTPDNLRLLSTMLIEQGYEVRSVINGKMALMGAKAEPPDLILLDINMPQMNGYEVCEHLKANPETAGIPIIFISALEDVLDKVKAFAVGGVDYITKPFQLEEVLVRIHTHLSLCRLQKQLQNQNQQLQQEIKEKEQAQESFTKAFRSSPNPIAIASLHNGKLLEVNPSFLHFSGYTLPEVIGQTVDKIWIDKQGKAIANAIQNLEVTGTIYNRELELKTKAEESRVVLISLEKIEISGQSCALLIINDITERKRLESEFIALVSHELRTPLTSMMGALDLLSSGQLGTLNTEGIKVLNIAVNNTERLIRLVNDILNLERMKSGKMNIKKVICQGEDIFLNAISTLQNMAEQAQVELIPQLQPVQLLADPDRLLQTLTNLLNNAIKFSEPGDKIWLNLSLIPEEQKALFSVQDEGRGIPDDKLEVIFERFQQVAISDAESRGGTGLGLAICRQIVEQHQGKIWVESQLGQGSCFYVLLPLN